MSEGLHKSKSGLIRALVRVEGGKIADVIVSGDFILVPERFIDDLEDTLLGVAASKEAVLSALKGFYARGGFQSPATYPEDFAEAVVKAVGGQSG